MSRLNETFEVLRSCCLYSFFATGGTCMVKLNGRKVKGTVTIFLLQPGF